MAKLGKVKQQRQPSTSALPPSSLSDAQNSCQCCSLRVPWHCWCFTITTQTRTISHVPALAAQLGLLSPRCPASLLQSPLPSILTPLWDTPSFRPPPNPLTCTGQFWEQNDPWRHCQLGSPAQGMSPCTRDVQGTAPAYPAAPITYRDIPFVPQLHPVHTGPGPPAVHVPAKRSGKGFFLHFPWGPGCAAELSGDSRQSGW